MAGLAGGGTVLASSYRFSLNRQGLQLAKLTTPLRVAQLSDLHFGRWIGTRSIRSWVDACLAENPDLILITGDFIDYSADEVTPLVSELARLTAPLGVWAVWGNHDYDLGGVFLDRFRQQLEQVGVNVLVNEGVSLRNDLYLAGLDDLWKGQADVSASMAERRPEQTCLLMAHIPDILPKVPASVDLTLCGHTHGGQVKVPFVGAVVTASAFGTRFLEGWITEPVPAFVSRGLGMVSLPLRFLSQAEIIIFDLEPNS